MCMAGGHTVHVPGMSVAGLCARFAPTIKWHRIYGNNVVGGGDTLASIYYKIIKWTSF